MKKKTIALATILLSLACIFTTCQMDVAEAESHLILVEPYITQQPESAAFEVGAAPNNFKLSIEYEDWDPEDGDLTFQWYTFSTLDKYLQGDVTPVGDATAEYTPTAADGFKTTAGSKNYYYVDVTNNNPKATNKKSSTVQSEVVIVSFYAVGATPPPLISLQPANAKARFGRSLNPLVVKAKPSAGGALSYLWYRVTLDADMNYTTDANGIPVGVAQKRTYLDEIPGTNPGDPSTFEEVETDADLPEFQLNPGDMKVGKNFYYVKIVNTVNSNTAEEISIPATLDIGKALRANPPVIATSPKPALYFGGDTPAPLTVLGTSTDYGTISYQWYRNTSSSSRGGAAISGANEASYTPPASTPNAYYYVVVSNTVPAANVEVATPATATTRAVNVRFAAAVDGDSHAKDSVLTIGSLTDPANKFNYVRGYGGMEVHWGNFPETFPADTELMYDPDRLGYNILRIMMPLTDTNVDIGMEYLLTTRRPHYYENVKIVNKYGGYVAAAPWSPPKEWKSNNSINGGGFLRPEYYPQYAAYLRAFAQHMYNKGAPIYVISIQNEPNYTAGYDGCEWKPAEMADFFARFGTFTQGVKGWGGGRETPRVLTMNGESANNVNINDAAIASAAAYANIDVFARHVYGERRTSLWSKLQGEKEVWMTEHNINSANATAYPNDSTWNYIWRFMNDIDLVMRLNNENAFVWWASKRFYSMVGDGQFGTPSGVALPRGWGLSHYSKFTIDMTRIGFTMTGNTADATPRTIAYTVDADNNPVINGAADDMDNITARITAYVSQDGNEISLVMWTPTQTNGDGGFNLGTIKIDMPTGFSIGSATAVRSRRISAQRNEFHTPYDVEVSSDRKSAYVTLERSQLISVKFTNQ